MWRRLESINTNRSICWFALSLSLWDCSSFTFDLDVCHLVFVVFVVVVVVTVSVVVVVVVVVVEEVVVAVEQVGYWC